MHQHSYPFLLTALIVFICIVSVSSKYLKQNFHLNKCVRDEMKYVTKCGIAPGKSTVLLRARFSRELREKQNLNFISFWYSAHNTSEWLSIKPDAICSSKVQHSHLHQEIQIPVSGEWSVKVVGDLVPSSEEQNDMFYFALTNCLDQVPEQQGKNKGIKLEVEIEILDAEGSHFALEDEDFLLQYAILLVLGLACFAFAMIKFNKDRKENEDLNWFFLIVLIAMGVFCFATMLDALHWWIYSSNGKGVATIQLFGQVFGVGSQFMIVVLLIMLSQGWTVNFMEIDSFDLTIPLAFLIGLIHLIVIGLGKLSDDSEKKFHTYYSWIGIVMVSMRIIAVCIFLYGARQLVKTARFKIKPFVYKLIIFGTLYLITMPALVFYSGYIVEYKRQQFVTFGIAYSQLIALGRLLYLCISKKTDYYYASIRGQSSLPVDTKAE